MYGSAQKAPTTYEIINVKVDINLSSNPLFSYKYSVKTSYISPITTLLLFLSVHDSTAIPDISLILILQLLKATVLAESSGFPTLDTSDFLFYFIYQND